MRMYMLFVLMAEAAVNVSIYHSCIYCPYLFSWIFPCCTGSWAVV